MTLRSGVFTSHVKSREGEGGETPNAVYQEREKKGPGWKKRKRGKKVP